MDTVEKIINLNHIKLNLDIKNKEDGLKKLSEISYENGITSDVNGIFEAIKMRESEFSTGFGGGFAIPHAKSEFVKEPAIFILKSADPVEWDSIDGNPVQVIIGLLVPVKHASNLHIKLLSSLSKYLIEDDFKETILKSNSKEEIYTYALKALSEGF